MDTIAPFDTNIDRFSLATILLLQNVFLPLLELFVLALLHKYQKEFLLILKIQVLPDQD